MTEKGVLDFRSSRSCLPCLDLFRLGSNSTISRSCLPCLRLSRLSLNSKISCSRLPCLDFLGYGMTSRIARSHSLGLVDPLRRSSVKIGTIQRRLTWPLRKDDTHKSGSVTCFLLRLAFIRFGSGIQDLSFPLALPTTTMTTTTTTTTSGGWRRQAAGGRRRRWYGA